MCYEECKTLLVSSNIVLHPTAIAGYFFNCVTVCCSFVLFFSLFISLECDVLIAYCTCVKDLWLGLHVF